MLRGGVEKNYVLGRQWLGSDEVGENEEESTVRVGRKPFTRMYGEPSERVMTVPGRQVDREESRNNVVQKRKHALNQKKYIG